VPPAFDPDAAAAYLIAADASLAGRVRVHLLQHQLAWHLPSPPARVLDVGGGAGHQAIPLAHEGYDVTIVDLSASMLDEAATRLVDEPAEVAARVRLVLGRGEDLPDLVPGPFDVVLCHGVLLYLEDPDPLLRGVASVLAPGGLVSLLTLQQPSLALRFALRHRWTEALSALDADHEVGVLGLPTRAETPEALAARLEALEVAPLAWYGGWLFADLLGPLDLPGGELEAFLALELEASRRDPYRRLSRVFHLLGRRTASAPRAGAPQAVRPPIPSA
jgi:S-adenosylmethionine-dependent methyltransferase